MVEGENLEYVVEGHASACPQTVGVGKFATSANTVIYMCNAILKRRSTKLEGASIHAVEANKCFMHPNDDSTEKHQQDAR